MTDVAKDLLRLRAAADAEVGRRWRRRGTAVVLLSLLTIAMAPPTFVYMGTLPAYSWATSYLHYPDGTVPGDRSDASSPDDGSRAAVTAWTVVGTATVSYLFVRIEATTVLDPVPAASVVAHWDADPPGLSITRTARIEKPSSAWGADAVGTIVDERALLASQFQQCSPQSVIGATGSYCLLTAAIDMGEQASLPDSILITDVVSAAPVFEVLLERDAYRVDTCQVVSCAELTAGP